MRGWTPTISISLALLLLSAVQLVVWGAGEEGVRVIVRSTARTSLLFFGLAFSASSLRLFWKTDASKWLLAQRRYLGVSYAVSHAIHAAALVALYQVSIEFSSTLDMLTLVGGGGAYAFTLAMALTSSDAAFRALGRSAWHRLHLIGGWYIWIIFAQSYLPRAFESLAYWPYAAPVLGILALRIARARHTKRAKA